MYFIMQYWYKDDIQKGYKTKGNNFSLTKMAAPLVNNMEEEKTFIRQGAEAKLYRGYFYGRPCYSKERFSKGYRHPTLDKNLTFQRLKAELRAMNRCRTLGIWTSTSLKKKKKKKKENKERFIEKMRTSHLRKLKKTYNNFDLDRTTLLHSLFYYHQKLERSVVAELRL